MIEKNILKKFFNFGKQDKINSLPEVKKSKEENTHKSKYKYRDFKYIGDNGKIFSGFIPNKIKNDGRYGEEDKLLRMYNSFINIEDMVKIFNDNQVDKNRIKVNRWCVTDGSGWPNEIVTFNLGTGEEIDASSGSGKYNRHRNLYNEN